MTLVSFHGRVHREMKVGANDAGSSEIATSNSAALQFDVRCADRRSFMKLVLLGAGAYLLPLPKAEAQAGQKVLRMATTLSDIPYLGGQANGGAEGIRFVNFSLYDALVIWDFWQGDRPTKIVPNLAESWSVNDTNKKVWTFKLRRGVKFHDGSEFNAHTVVWNFEKLMKPDAALRQAASRGRRQLHGHDRSR